jgi:hypothetical protein
LDNLSYSLLLKLDTGATGSGFIVNTTDKSILVTAKHVLFDSSGGIAGNTLSVTGYSKDIEDGDVVAYSVQLAQLASAGKVLTSATDDVAALVFGDVAADRSLNLRAGITLQRAPRGCCVGVPISLMKPLKDVLIANRVFVQGYPSSVGLKHMPQIDPDKPLVRTGIVAGKNVKLNTIILDCEVYPGNSGGPVLELEQDPPHGNRTKLIGLVSQYVPFVNQVATAIGAGVFLNNSGYSVVVPCDPILALLTNTV